MPFDVEDSVKTAHVEGIELLGVVAVDSPGLTSIEECRKYYSMVDLQLDCHLRYQTFSPSLPKTALALAILFVTSVSLFTTR